jgi:hypothetical protein
VVAGFFRDITYIPSKKPGRGPLQNHTFVSFYQLDLNGYLKLKWLKNYDFRWGGQYESFVDTLALSDDGKIVYLAERYEKKGLVINATNGEPIFIIEFTNTSSHQIKSAFVNYNLTTDTYLAYIVSQN